jgi:cob(I)alamin adenosyltransferase
VRKEHARIEAYGTVDELSSLLGLLRCEEVPDGVSHQLVAIQEVLFSIGAVLADPEGRVEHDTGVWDAEVLEGWIDAMDQDLESLKSFILPGGSRAAAVCHVARTVCRRAERRVGLLVGEGGGVPEGLLAYLNRLSDALFTLARFVNARAGVPETEWQP